MIPKGFKGLVKRVLDQDPASWRVLPDNVDDTWNNFAWAVFLDANRSDAEVNYLYDVFSSAGLLELDKIRKLGPRWSDLMCKVCEKEMKSARGRKRGLLSAITNDLAVEKTTRCILEAAEYFLQVSPEMIMERTANEKETNELIAEIAYPGSPSHVYNIGLTKTVLWLQSFGLALHACPPSRQVISFAIEDLGIRLEHQRYENEELGVWGYYFILVKKIQEISKDLSNSLKTSITPRDVGKAIWYYKSCQSLVAQLRAGLKWKFTPKVLLEFLDSKGWKLADLADRLGDIDEIDGLKEELETFVRGV